MENRPSTIFIYHSNLYPDLPLIQNEISAQFSYLRRMSADREFQLYRNSQLIIPPTHTTFKIAWRRFFFPDSESYIKIERPNYFSDLYELLHNYEFYHNYEQERVSSPYQPRRIYHQITDADIRYCFILAATNIVFYLKNMILSRTNMFGKIDYIIPHNTGLENISLRRITSSSTQKILHLESDIYRQLDYFLMTKQIEDFWNQMIYIVDQITPTMLVFTHESSILNNFLLQALSQKINEDHIELKMQIIYQLNIKKIPEHILGAIYDLILERHMQLPSF